jgi:hypothetical protein
MDDVAADGDSASIHRKVAADGDIASICHALFAFDNIM